LTTCCALKHITEEKNRDKLQKNSDEKQIPVASRVENRKNRDIARESTTNQLLAMI